VGPRVLRAVTGVLVAAGVVAAVRGVALDVNAATNAKGLLVFAQAFRRDAELAKDTEGLI
jgi:hypothetical protein